MRLEANMQGTLKKLPTGRFYLEISPSNCVELTSGRVIEVSYLGHWMKARIEYSFELKSYYLVIGEIGTRDFGAGLTARLV
jgi:hypothetical protein